MTRKQRHLVYEAIGIMLAAFFGLFTVTTLINAHDTIALVSAFGLIAVWAGWVLFFVYRFSKEIK